MRAGSGIGAAALAAARLAPWGSLLCSQLFLPRQPDGTMRTGMMLKEIASVLEVTE